jgi:hypothetical protein
MKKQLAIGLTALVSVSMLAACSSDDDSGSAVQEANSEFCQNLSALGTSLTAFAALDPTTATKAEYEEAADAVRSAGEELADSGSDLVDAEKDNLESQVDDLEGALTEASDDAVVADIVTAAQAQVAEVQASAAAVDTAICTAENSATTTDG